VNFDIAKDEIVDEGFTSPEPAPAPINPFDVEAVKEKFASAKAAINIMMKDAEAFSVTDNDTQVKAVEMAGQAKELHKKIEARRKEVVAAPNKFVKSVNGFCKGFLSDLEGIEKNLKAKIGSYRHKVEMARREAERKAQEEAKKLQEKINQEAKEKKIDPVQIPKPVAPEPEKVTRTETGTSAFVKKIWVHEIVNAQEIPREYCVPSEPLIRLAIKQGVRKIPGVKIEEKEQVNLRTA